MLNIDIHRSVLLQILKEFYSQISLGPILGFKGGTAVHFFYNLPRFSIDLDFDLLDNEKEKFVFKKVESILKSFGEIKEKAEKKNTIFFILSYSKEAQNIKIEISKRKLGSNYEIKNYLGISMLVMKKEDMFAHKLVTLLERGRTANRDLFDIWFFLKNHWGLNEMIVEKRTGIKLRNYLEKCVKFVEKINERHILAGMGELLDKETKFWVKKNLKKELLFLLRIYLNP